MKNIILLICFGLPFLLAAQTSDNPYHKMEEAREGLRLVKYNDKYGYVNEKMQEVIELKYADAESFYGGMAKVSINGKEYGMIEKNGKVAVPFEYDYIATFVKGFAPAKKDGKWGMINNKGKNIIAHEYDNIYHFNEGLALGLKKVNGVNIYGFINEKGEEVIPFQYTSANSFSDGLAIVRQMDGKYGFINTKGQTVIPFLFSDAKTFNDGLAAVKQNGKWGFIDQKGNIKIQPEFSRVNSFSNGEAMVHKGSDKFYINTDGKRLKPGTWLIIFERGMKGGERWWFRDEKLENGMITKKYNEGYRVFHIADNLHDNEVFVILHKSSVSQPMVSYDNTYDRVWKKIKDDVSNSKSISHLSYGKHKWTYVNSGTKNNNTVYSNTGFPKEGYKKARTEGKFVSAMAYDGNRWLVSMSKAGYKDEVLKDYYYSWDEKDVAEMRSKGYDITHVVKYGSNYKVVFTKGTGIKEQQLLWSDEIPTLEIKKFADKGYEVYKAFYLPRDLDDLFF